MGKFSKYVGLDTHKETIDLVNLFVTTQLSGFFHFQ